MEWIELGELSEVISGYAFKSKKYVNEGIRIIRITNVQNGYLVDENPKYYTKEDMIGLEQYLLSKDDILISLTGNVGRVARMKERFLPAALNQRVACIRPRDGILDDYLYYITNSLYFEDECINQSKGVAQKNLGITNLKKIKIPVPPLAIQEQIVEVLDRAQELIDKRRTQLEALDSLIESIFYTMFGDPVSNEKGWEVKKLGEFGAWSSGGTPSRKNKEYFQGEIYWYTAGELNYRYTKESEEKITLEAIEQSSAKIFKAGSLFVGMYDSAAFKLSILNKDASSNQACANLLPNENYNVEWLYDLFMMMKPTYLSRRQGVRQKNLSQGMIKNFEAISPPLDLQNEFAQKVELIEREKEVLEASLELMEENYRSIMDRAFKGELFN